MSLIIGKYYRGDPKQKPKQWGPASVVQAAIRENAAGMGIDPESIILCVPMWEMAGDAHSYGNLPNWALSQDQWHNNRYKFYGSGQRDGTELQILQNPEWTILLKAQFLGNPLVASAFLYEIGVISGGDYWEYKIQYGKLAIRHYNNFTGIGTDITGIVSNDPFSFAYRTKSATDHSVFYDGKKEFEDLSTSIGTADAWRQDFHLKSDADNNWEIDHTFVFSTALTDSQIVHLSDNPYVLIQRPTLRTYFDFDEPGSDGVLTSGIFGVDGGLTLKKSYHRQLSGVL